MIFIYYSNTNIQSLILFQILINQQINFLLSILAKQNINPQFQQVLIT